MNTKSEWTRDEKVLALGLTAVFGTAWLLCLMAVVLDWNWFWG